MDPQNLRTSATTADEIRVGVDRRLLAAFDRIEEARRALAEGNFARAHAIITQARDHVQALAAIEQGFGSFARLRMIQAKDLPGLLEQARDADKPLAIFQFGTVESVEAFRDPATPNHGDHDHFRVTFGDVVDDDDREAAFCDRQEILVDVDLPAEPAV